jgi:glucose/arabinose dehydrogenase
MKKLLLIICLLPVLRLTAQTPDLKLELFSSGYNDPVELAHAGDDRLFIVERAGIIWIADTAGNKGALPFLDIVNRVLSSGGEQGLLGLAFHPDYKTNGYFYVNYTNKKGNTVIARYQVSANDSNKANKASQQIILSIKQPYTNHNGGCIKFGPDGYLYIATGDGGSGGDPENYSQNIKSLLGKILRLDVDGAFPYAIPPDNPFVNTNGYRKEIWNLGVRNPWRISFDRLTGDLWIADVGQEQWEEINLQAAAGSGGENYGWRCYEGTHEYNLTGCSEPEFYTFPIVEYKHGVSNCSVTGGYVYRGAAYPNLYGKYLYSDFCSGKIKMIYFDGVWQNELLADEADFAHSTFGEDVNGEVYLASLSDGNIYRLTDASALVGEKQNFVSASAPAMVYPNPALGSFAVLFTAGAAGKGHLNMFDLAGRMVFTTSEEVNAGRNEWKVNGDWPAGEYFISIHTASQVHRLKVILTE